MCRALYKYKHFGTSIGQYNLSIRASSIFYNHSILKLTPAQQVKFHYLELGQELSHKML